MRLLNGKLISVLLLGVAFVSIHQRTFAEASAAQQQAARDIYRELVEINTVTETGDSARAADAMTARLRSAGFAEEDVQVFKPARRKGNLVARLHGTAKRRPILLLAHLDVVEAKPEDWSVECGD